MAVFNRRFHGFSLRLELKPLRLAPRLPRSPTVPTVASPGSAVDAGGLQGAASAASAAAAAAAAALSGWDAWRVPRPSAGAPHLRELERLQTLREYSHALLRIRLPNGVTAQACFHPQEPVVRRGGIARQHVFAGHL